MDIEVEDAGVVFQLEELPRGTMYRRMWKCDKPAISVVLRSAVVAGGHRLGIEPSDEVVRRAVKGAVQPYLKRKDLAGPCIVDVTDEQYRASGLQGS
ncbi:MAG: hypothetical protein AB7Q30_12170 [Vicinamibacteria bacterium]